MTLFIKECSLPMQFLAEGNPFLTFLLRNLDSELASTLRLKIVPF